jgi:hypothetical protein
VPLRTGCSECRTGFIETARAACGGQLFDQTEHATGRRRTRPIVDNVGDLARIYFLWAVAWLRTMAVRRSRGGRVINPRTMAVLIRDSATDPFKDKTRRVSEIQTAGQRIEIVFNSSTKIFRYGRDRVSILRDPRRPVLTDGERVEANGSIWQNATEVVTFTGTGGAWSRIFYTTQAGEEYTTYPASRVRVIASATEAPVVALVLDYWRTVVSRLPRDDPLQPRYERLAFVHPESVLNSFLAGSPIESRPLTRACGPACAGRARQSPAQRRARGAACGAASIYKRLNLATRATPSGTPVFQRFWRRQPEGLSREQARAKVAKIVL